MKTWGRITNKFLNQAIRDLLPKITDTEYLTEIHNWISTQTAAHLTKVNAKWGARPSPSRIYRIRTASLAIAMTRRFNLRNRMWNRRIFRIINQKTPTPNRKLASWAIHSGSIAQAMWKMWLMSIPMKSTKNLAKNTSNWQSTSTKLKNSTNNSKKRNCARLIRIIGINYQWESWFQMISMKITDQYHMKRIIINKCRRRIHIWASRLLSLSMGSRLGRTNESQIKTIKMKSFLYLVSARIYQHFFTNPNKYIPILK